MGGHTTFFKTIACSKRFCSRLYALLLPPDSKALMIYEYGNIEIIFFHIISIFISCISINNLFDNYSFSIFNENSKLVSTTHSYKTRSACNGLLFVPNSNSVRFRRKSIFHSTTLTSPNKLTEYKFLCFCV